ncbi:MAG: cation-transporting P-type ATPase [Ktedonobacteraceae bacterium]|nr:cation-transporting P-type ATPase [Ktedonobacteraceae bacterium]
MRAVHKQAASPEQPWQAWSIADLRARFAVDPASGLTEQEARKRLARYGPNALREEKRESFWSVFLEEVREPMILLLLVTGVLYSLWGKLQDALTIFAVILVLVGVEVYNEYRAKQAIAGLSKLAEPTASVRREGQYQEVPVEAIVPGDILLLEAGRRVPADARLFEAYSLATDEAALTGESVPVEKDAGPVLAADTPLAERRNQIYAGTTVTRGRGSALVVATGMQTELGRIAGMARAARTARTPLQATMRDLTFWLVWLALGFSVLVPLLGWLLAGQPLPQMLLTGLSLAFAVIPEELPIIITMVLALGGYRLAQQHAIVKRLQAVETLGAITTIATDKTGTLTENRMQVSCFYPEALKSTLLEMGALCNSAAERGEQLSGDPLEVALLQAARDAGVNIADLRHAHLLRDEFTFDNRRKRMSTVYGQDTLLHVVVKGSPETVLAQCSRYLADGQALPLTQAERENQAKKAAEMAGEGLRVIALAEKIIQTQGTHLTQDEAESDLTFAGFIGLADPPRAEVKEAIAACRRAGVRPLMITGDHPLTARSIAQQVGLDGSTRLLSGPELDALSDDALKEAVAETSIYARTTPEHKLRIVRALHERGERVAVTGDGINDAPALVSADIGVAMGETGTDVAREAADMVLADDNFTTIVHAIQEGRVLFANLRKGVRYYLACKVALISSTLLPVLLHVPVPFAPVQIILMELFMDLAASATFVNEPPESDLMRQPPRDPRAPFMDRAMVGGIFSGAGGLFVAVSVAYLITWYMTKSISNAQTIAFVTWLLGHVSLAINMRSEREPLVRLGFFSNRLMNLWAAATVIFILFATLVPGVQGLLKTATPTGGQWLLVVAVAVLGTFWIEGRKLLLRGRDRKN